MAITLASVTVQEITFTAVRLGNPIYITYRNASVLAPTYLPYVTIVDREIIFDIVEGFTNNAHILMAIAGDPAVAALITGVQNGQSGTKVFSVIGKKLSSDVVGVPVATFASIEVGGLIYTSITDEEGGNALRIIYEDGALANASYNAPLITIVFPASGLTGLQIAAEIAAHIPSICSLSSAGVGMGVKHKADECRVERAFTGGKSASTASIEIQDLTFETDAVSADYNTKTITYTDSGTAGVETVIVTDGNIDIGMESGVSTAQEIKNACEAEPTFTGTQATGTIEVTDWTAISLKVASSSSAFIVTGSTQLAEDTSSGTFAITDWEEMPEATAIASGTYAVGIIDAPGDTIIVHAAATHTFTRVASNPGLNEFLTGAQAMYLIGTVPGINTIGTEGEENSVIVTIDHIGPDANSWDITGTGAYEPAPGGSHTDVTFSGGQVTTKLNIGGEIFDVGAVASTDNDTTLNAMAALIESTSTLVHGGNDNPQLSVWAKLAGTLGDTYVTQVTQGLGITADNPTLIGGQDDAIITIGAEEYNLNAFVSGGNENSADAIASYITSNSSIVSSTNSGATILLSALIEGSIGNYSLAVTQGLGIETDEPMVGGHSPSTFTIAGVELLQATDFDDNVVSLTTAIDDLDGVSAFYTNAVITIVADEIGTDGNAIAMSIVPSGGVTFSGPTLVGGTDKYACTITGNVSNTQSTVNRVELTGQQGQGPDALYSDEDSMALTTSYQHLYFHFHASEVSIFNDEVGGTNNIIFSWNGIEANGTVEPGQSFVWDKTNETQIYLKYGNGAPDYRLYVQGQ